MKVRFLSKSEFAATKDLAKKCFGNLAEIDNYYEHDVFNNRIAVIEDGMGIFYSMVQLRRFIAVYEDYSVPAWYILYVCTLPDKQNQGLITKLMKFVLETLKQEQEPFTFLVPVKKEVYSSLDFNHCWKFNPDERELLYADSGLNECVACTLNDNNFVAPLKLKYADSIEDFHYKKFDNKSTCKYFNFFQIRPNRSCSSVALQYLSHSERYNTHYAILDNRCILIKFNLKNSALGCIPFCKEKELPYYFKLQEMYFNQVLNVPLNIGYADREGVTLLKNIGYLDNYEIIEYSKIFDYIYDGDDLRNLPGRAFSKKRNRIRKFEREFYGRWEYRTLSYKDREDIISFLKSWLEEKKSDGVSSSLCKTINSKMTLDFDVNGAINIVNHPELSEKVSIGGIYVDGKLSALSIGCYNALEKMAVIEIEKAYSKMDGLYQLINREFLLHEFPHALIVNREDDAGIPGLRKAKMSYNPSAFANYFSLKQKNFP